MGHKLEHLIWRNSRHLDYLSFLPFPLSLLEGYKTRGKEDSLSWAIAQEMGFY